MNDLRTIPKNRPLDLQSSRYYDPSCMDVQFFGRQSDGVVAGKRAGENLPGTIRRPPGDADRRDALKAAIRAYANAYRIGAAHEIDRTWAACMQEIGA